MSHPGRVKANNEDHYATLAIGERSIAMGTVLVVADGVGGHRCGAVASRLAIETLSEWFSQDRPEQIGQCQPLESIASQAISAANSAIYAAAASAAELDGMASTTTLVLVTSDQAVMAHVGDSRAYLIRRGASRQLSHDDTWVAHAIAAGAIHPADAHGHRLRHVLTQAVGFGPCVSVETSAVAIERNDRLLLCTDGLTRVVGESEIAQIVAARQPGDAARGLVDLANKRGAPDNVTVIVARVEASHE
jgi:PPM family protein phosphatase